MQRLDILYAQGNPAHIKQQNSDLLCRMHVWRNGFQMGPHHSNRDCKKPSF